MIPWLFRSKPSPAHHIARRLSGDPSASEIASARRDALREGCWSVLAARFPQHFRDGFVLRGGPAIAMAPIAQREPPVPAMPIERLADLVGKDVFLRVMRCDQSTEIVAAKIDRVEGNAIVFKDYDPLAAGRMAQPGDSLWYSFFDESPGPLTLNDGDTITAAVVLPVDFAVLAGPTHKRIPLRERAEEIAAGRYVPRIDLTDPERYLARNPETGKPWTGPDGMPVFLDEFVVAVKVEQNALALPLTHRIGEVMCERMRDDDVRKAFAALPLEEWLEAFDRLVVRPGHAAVIDDARANPASALGIAFANMERVCKFSGEFLPGGLPVADRSDASRLLLGGAFTAASSMIGLAQGAWRFHREAGTSAADLFGASASTTIRLASLPLKIFGLMPARLLFRHTEPADQRFELTRYKGGHRLELNRSACEDRAKNNGWVTEGMVAGTTGCPAAQSLGGKNMVNEFAKAFGELFAEWEKAQAPIAD